MPAPDPIALSALNAAVELHSRVGVRVDSGVRAELMITADALNEWLTMKTLGRFGNHD